MLRILAAATVAVLLAACASSGAGRIAKETLYVVNAANRLISINGGRPEQPLSDRALAGLAPGERVIGIDYRVARGQLFALGSSGTLYRIDTASATASAVGGISAVPLRGIEFGFDFNPTVDRIRVVSDAGLNLRLHPDTGAVVDGDPGSDGLQLDGTLAWAAGDRNAGRRLAVVAAAYSYNKVDERITTNYAIDAANGLLVMQGSKEGATPVVSPNTGRVSTVGPLRVGEFDRASFDIADVGNAAYAAFTRPFARESVLYRIDLATGSATRIGPIAGGRAVAGIAIEP
ncbi:MAG TPA: DUF4394 domain-containing protein [Burkholderiaceae bacterium]|nr:DUF4394 domain-containing protein [Burkholderiaceae bacterium]